MPLLSFRFLDGVLRTVELTGTETIAELRERFGVWARTPWHSLHSWRELVVSVPPPSVLAGRTVVRRVPPAPRRRHSELLEPFCWVW